jgi:hypothetical protein
MKRVELQEPEVISLETSLWSGQDSAKSLELDTAAVEARLAQLEANEENEKGEVVTDSGERPEPGTPAPRRPTAKAAPPKGQGSANGVWKQGASSREAQAANQTAKRRALSTADISGERATSASGARSAKLSGAGTRLGTGTLKPERPPDAWSLLREAKEAGVFFQEDSRRDGHTEQSEDPELAAAVEETIRLLFGVRGIVRVGAGRNEKAEPIVVVVASHGFSDASLASVPEKVHRFTTVIAIPFELLPLRRDR